MFKPYMVNGEFSLMSFRDLSTMSNEDIVIECHNLRHLRSHEKDNITWRIITNRLGDCQQELRQRKTAFEKMLKEIDEKPQANWDAFIKYINQVNSIKE